MLAPDKGDVLVVDVATRLCGTAHGFSLSRFTERHAFELGDVKTERPWNAAAEETRRAAALILVLQSGLVGRSILSVAKQGLSRGQAVYFCWPEEVSIEVVDFERLRSFRRLRLAAVAFGVVATLKQRVSAAVRAPARYIGSARRTIGSARRTISAVSSPQTWVAADNMMRDRIANGLEKRSHGSRVANVLRDPIAFGRAVTELARDSSKGLRASAAVDPLKGQKIVPVPVRFLDPSKLPSPEHPIRGKALYVRLDYWAKLKAGGSYGHTCFVAKSESRVTEQFECIMAQRYALLDSLGVSQRVLEAEYSSASIADLILSAPELLPQLRRVFDEGEVSYVYERSVLGNWCAAQLCQERGIPYIVEYNGSELAMARSFGTPHKLEGLLEQIEDYSFAAATMISVVSQPIADSLVKRGVAADKILVNPNCVDPDVYCPLPDPEREQLRAELGFGADDVVVGFCGTFGGWHGIEVLAAAMPTICQRDRRISFLLIGDGNLKHLVHAAIEQHGLQDRVRDLGLVPQLEAARYLAACDILLSPHSSNIDGGIFFGSPTKLFEYMALGAAIVCSDLAQLGEVMSPALRLADFADGSPAVTHQRGILVTPGVVDELVEAVGYLSSNAELRKALGSNARKAAIENFTWDSHVENLWRFLAGVPLKGYAQAGQRGEK